MIEYKLRYSKLITFLFIAVGPILFWVFVIRHFASNPTELSNWISWVATLLLLTFFSIPLFLSLTYILEDFHKSVIIDKKNRSISIRKKNKVYTINQDEIIASYQVSVNPNTYRRLSLPWFKYALIVKKERKRFFITNLICEPIDILKFIDIEFKDIYFDIPYIDRAIGSEFLTTEEFNKKVLEFENEFINHSEQDLSKIVNDKKTYTDYARQAASNLLKRKNNHTCC